MTEWKRFLYRAAVPLVLILMLVGAFTPVSTEAWTNGDNGNTDHKITICHATGSATNPYVEITISNNAVPAHRRHQDGRDIIPAPAGGCPTSSGAAPVHVSAATPAPAPKITICHATGSRTHPYVEITISSNGLNGHAGHQDGRDIIPAPAGGCPTGVAQATPAPAAPAPAATPSATAQAAAATAAPAAPAPSPAVAAVGALLGEGSVPAAAAPAVAMHPSPAVTRPRIHRSRPSPAIAAPAPVGGVAGVAHTISHRPAAARMALAAPAPASRRTGGVLGAVGSVPATIVHGTLPFTGFKLWIVLATGLVFFVAGFALRRLARSRRSLLH